MQYREKFAKDMAKNLAQSAPDMLARNLDSECESIVLSNPKKPPSKPDSN